MNVEPKEHAPLSPPRGRVSTIEHIFERRPPLSSPDGEHVALRKLLLQEFTAAALDVDAADLTVAELATGIAALRALSRSRHVTEGPVRRLRVVQ